MKAVIMAGGEGTRLKAVTGSLPKPMVPFLGKPLLEHIVALLKANGFDEICMAVRYRAGDIIAHFGDGHRLGVKISYCIEDKPLGTAGAVKNCAEFWGNEDFLVISGDCVCDMPLSLIAEEHHDSAAAVTLALHRDPCPLRYGLAVTDSEGEIRCFIEKPRWNGVVTDLINTGIYMISPKAMEFVPKNEPFDFAKDLFPLLLARGEKLHGTVAGGYWCDVGTPLSYYKCCQDALEGRLALELPPEFAANRSHDDSDSHLPEGIDCPCRDRAAVMGVLSQELFDMGADYSDGLSLKGRHYSMRISPRAEIEALRVSVHSDDSEFARSLMHSAKALIEALNL